jgi:hypothetical protein
MWSCRCAWFSRNGELLWETAYDVQDTASPYEPTDIPDLQYLAASSHWLSLETSPIPYLESMEMP